MSTNFSNSVNNFLNNNSSYTSESLRNELSDIADELYNKGKAITSIFKIKQDTNMDKTAFTSLFADACDNSLDDVNQNQVELLYSILDTDGDGNLTHDELSVFADSNGEITDFNMWQVVKLYSAKGDTSQNSTDDSTPAGTTSTPTGTTSTPAGTTSTPDSSTPAASTPDSSTPDSSTPAASTPAASTPAGTTPTSEDSTSTPTTPVNSTSVIGNPNNVNSELQFMADDFWYAMNTDYNKDPYRTDNDGTNEKKIKDVLNSNISDEEFVDMVIYFEYNHGLAAPQVNTLSGKRALVTLLAKELSWASPDITEDEAEELFAKRLIRAANAGDEDAIALLALEVYGATAGQTGTQKTFLDTVFDANSGVSDEVIKKMHYVYRQFVSLGEQSPFTETKGNMTEDISKDYSSKPSWFSRVEVTYS